MKLALVGYGQMGQMIEKVALSSAHTIVARINSKVWDEEALAQADVCIEFTHPECVVQNMKKLASMGKNIVVGTTGWDEKSEEVQDIVAQAQIGLVYSPNFSMGVQLTFQILKQAAKIMHGFTEYDVAGIEFHHHKKKDSPSGTAHQMAHLVSAELGQEVPFSSVRCGSIPGTHTVLFDSPYDTISIKHEARTREGFAKGAVQAAEWIKGKKGIFTFAQCMEDLLMRKLS